MDTIKEKVLHELSSRGLKITPQRIAVFEVLLNSNDHPTVEAIHKRVLSTIPGISVTTIYNTLDTFVQKGLVKRVKTDTDVMRYEPMSEPHHHLYSSASDRMQDYIDPELDSMLIEYFKKKKIKNFSITEIRLQLMGDFQDINKDNKQPNI